MRWMQFLFPKYLLLAFVGFVGACGDAPSTTGGAASAAPAPAAAGGEEGLRFTIDGPVFGGPTSFVVPGGGEHLRLYMSDNMFSLMLNPKRSVTSEDGKHVLDMLVLGTEPAGEGEFTESSNVTEFSLGFVAHEGTPQSQSVSMSFRSKGVKQPVRLVVSQYDLKSDTTDGQFTARLRRSNIKSTDQFYEVKGEFLAKD